MSTPAALRVVEGRWAVFRHAWRGSVITGFLQPLLYLAGMGLGVGRLVDRNAGSGDLLDGVPYAAFIAPGLLAATAMTTASIQASWPVLDDFVWQRGYERMHAAPLGVRAIVDGELCWWALHLLFTSTAVAIVMALFPDARSSTLPLAALAAVLCGLAFATPIGAYAATLQAHQSSSFATLSRIVIMPLYLFAGAFFPITSLPGWLQAVAKVTPLYHGVELCRGITLHRLDAAAAAPHLAVLAAYVAAGWVGCLVAYRRRLSQ